MLKEQFYWLFTAFITVLEVLLLQNASDGGALVGRRTLRIIRTLLDHFASLPSALQSIDVLTDAFAASQKTPVRFPSLMSKFR